MFHKILNIWKPRTEIGRKIKHKTRYGLRSQPPFQRQMLKQKKGVFYG